MVAHIKSKVVVVVGGGGNFHFVGYYLTKQTPPATKKLKKVLK